MEANIAVGTEGAVFSFGPAGWDLPCGLQEEDVQWQGEGRVEIEAWCLGLRPKPGSGRERERVVIHEAHKVIPSLIPSATLHGC